MRTLGCVMRARERRGVRANSANSANSFEQTARVGGVSHELKKAAPHATLNAMPCVLLAERRCIADALPDAVVLERTAVRCNIGALRGKPCRGQGRSYEELAFPAVSEWRRVTCLRVSARYTYERRNNIGNAPSRPRPLLR